VSTEPTKRIPLDVKLEWVFGAIFLVAAIAFLLSGSIQIGGALLGGAGGLFLGGFLRLASHYEFFGASKK
jgi:hypothetical protein